VVVGLTQHLKHFKAAGEFARGFFCALSASKQPRGVVRALLLHLT